VRAAALRQTQTDAERRLWYRLRNRQLLGLKFRRQHPIVDYFADFACVSRKLVIEIDGEQHAYQVEADARRTAVIESLGWRVVRFWANEVVANPEGIWSEIEQVTKDPVTPSPNLSP